ncbi:DUF6339 family protein [Pseudarthrobacter sp. C1]|uniref:DUF6339 family protein n=1 Tax=Pseudarthrobacter sp. C1 TaxID=3108940 RepID=UPI002B053571|nr:DUF6339 family protein [Pseudarthrobacter sp. C1]MEA3549237.1 DUF6339 family protein [Pseudarthrobacter sp. C1]
MSENNLLTLFNETAVDRHILRLREAESAVDFVHAISVIADDADSRFEVEWKFHSEVPELRYDRSGNGLPSGFEAQNAIDVFCYLGDMTPVEASDRRLWTYLSTVTFFDYTSHRWSLDREKWQNRVLDRWLMPRGGRAELVRNSISRLWWVANLTHDPGRQRPLSKATDDPFAYTKVAMEKEDRFLAIFDRDSGMMPELRFALLEHFMKDAAYSREDYIREFMKEVILMTGYRELVGLSSEQMRDALDSISERLDRTLVDA